MDVLNLLSTGLSGIGAVIAIWQARKAKKYRDEILRDRTKILLIDTIGVAKKAREECRKIITPVGKPVRGVNQQEVINSIRDCLDKLKDNTHKFEKTNIASTITSLDSSIANYINEIDNVNRFSEGDRIYEALGEIIREIAHEIDRNV